MSPRHARLFVLRRFPCFLRLFRGDLGERISGFPVGETMFVCNPPVPKLCYVQSVALIFGQFLTIVNTTQDRLVIQPPPLHCTKALQNTYYDFSKRAVIWSKLLGLQ